MFIIFNFFWFVSVSFVRDIIYILCIMSSKIKKGGQESGHLLLSEYIDWGTAVLKFSYTESNVGGPTNFAMMA